MQCVSPEVILIMKRSRKKLEEYTALVLPMSTEKEDGESGEMMRTDSAKQRNVLLHKQRGVSRT